jgi:hypothetical protein
MNNTRTKHNVLQTTIRGDVKEKERIYRFELYSFNALAGTHTMFFNYEILL